MTTDGLYCQPAVLDWSADGGPRASDYGDVYFSAEDGLEETRAVFLRACGLPEAWAGRRNYTVGELGFGTGLNALGLWQLWRDNRPADGWLDLVSIEKHPLDRTAAARAFAAWPQLAGLAGCLLAQWPSRLRGPQRLVFPEDRFAITVFQDEVEAALAQIEGPVDAWFLDGFAPDRNAAMWSQPVFDRIGALSAPGARIGTFTVAGFVRRGLAEAGFAVAKQPGFGRKRERLEAIWPGEAVARARPLEGGPVAVIGAGIAGASLTHALTARGIDTVLIDQPGAPGMASNAPAGLLTPRLEKADRPHVRATMAAFDFARRLYDGRDGFHADPVIRLPRDEREAARFAVLAAWLPDHLDWQGHQLLIRCGGRFEPSRLVAGLIGGCARQDWQFRRHEASADGVRLFDKDDVCRLEAAHLVIATGAGSAAVCSDVSASAGQVAVFEGRAPEAPVSWGHYACRAGAGVLVGATHVRGERAAPDEAAEAGFRQAVAARMPRLALGDVCERWSGVRASTPDRLPIVGALDQRVSILSGLGSRGFAHAPLLAEDLVSRLSGGASVLAMDGRVALAPQRFAQRRARKAGQTTG
ncbi:tRNA (5-methylaminomethyl-2-thiouridine)(34)-methyltransferase MnmD [Maricaulis sp.]|uniref:tRNA (5-methylaminomethyl-2-thiouridine)(34)-methyltransferase MnmD n=1 Tax=Maricaulis sp. TaxID=1486257 RepID=UPI0025B85A0D|nr:tRNA (5-methylaminomethyl-2-thiouridine)(34)-methyltransferase MnmD [Maricaulis sp.]